MTRIFLAISFLTRLPTPEVKANEVDVARASGWFPLSGAIVGFSGIFFFFIGKALWGPAIAAVLATAAFALTTGGLHLDGLADCLDGWLCNGTTARRQRVMHDPHIGALSSVFLSLFLMLKVGAVLACYQRGMIWPALWSAPILARAPLAWELFRGPASTPGQGMYAHLHPQIRQSDVALSAGLAFGLVLPSTLLVPDCRAILTLGLVACLLFSIAWHHHWRILIGGLSGDVLGAAVEIRELLLLLLIALPGFDGANPP